MPHAGAETRSTRIFSERKPKRLLMATGPIGLAASMRYLATTRKRSLGFEEPSTWETTTTHGLYGTRTGITCAAIVSINGCLPRFAPTPINVGRNLALLLSDASFGARRGSLPARLFRSCRSTSRQLQVQSVDLLRALVAHQ